MLDHYRTIAAPATATTRVQRSVFDAHAFPLASEEQFPPILETLQKENFDATHHCWAYRLLGDEGSVRSRSADAGEPAGTAGKPILSAIEGAELYDLCVVVVRWFGGVKLGTGGLGRAYREAAQAALGAASPQDRYRYMRFEVEVPFDALNTVYRLIAPPDIVLRGEDFGARNLFSIDVRISYAETFAKSLQERRLRYTRPS